jgi:hypothetical protein
MRRDPWTEIPPWSVGPLTYSHLCTHAHDPRLHVHTHTHTGIHSHAHTVMHKLAHVHTNAQTLTVVCTHILSHSHRCQ